MIKNVSMVRQREEGKKCTNGRAAWVGARVFDVVRGDLGGFGVEEGEEGFGEGHFGRHCCRYFL
jgi:hypothetical protein